MALLEIALLFVVSFLGASVSAASLLPLILALLLSSRAPGVQARRIVPLLSLIHIYRFFMRVSLGYPSLQDEMDILDRYCGEQKPMESVVPVCSSEDVIAMQQAVKTVYCSKEVRAYIASICAATRNTPLLSLGASTRAAIALIHAAPVSYTHLDVYKRQSFRPFMAEVTNGL